MPVYVDNSATDAWAITATGFIHYAASGGGAAIPDFYLNLSSPTNVTLGTTQARGSLLVSGAVISQSAVPSVCTITDDDVQPTVTISDATEVGGTVTFVATLSAASGKTITFVADTANGTKTAGVDYTALTGSTVTFNPGETTKNIVVTAL